MPTKSLHVTAYTKDGFRIRSFKAIGRFLKFAKINNKLAPHTLSQLRTGKVIYKGGYLLMLSKFSRGMRISPLQCKHMLRKFNAKRIGNIEKLSAINKKLQVILVVDRFFNFLYIHHGSLSSLSKREHVPIGTIKASLSKSPNSNKQFQPNTRKEFKYFVHLKDLQTFINSIKIVK